MARIPTVGGRKSVKLKVAVAGFATSALVATLIFSLFADSQLTGKARDLDTAAKDAAVRASEQHTGSSFQDALLHDGELTTEEYDVAFSSYSGCARGAGGTFVPDPPNKNIRGTWNYSVRVAPLADGLRNDSAIRAVQDCGAEYFDAIQSRWTAEHMATHAEVEAARAGIVTCMSERGIEMPESLPAGWGQAYFGKPAPDGLRTDREAGRAFAECSKAAGELLGYGDGSGLVP